MKGLRSQCLYSLEGLVAKIRPADFEMPVPSFLWWGERRLGQETQSQIDVF